MEIAAGIQPLTTREVQLASLDIVKRVDRICRSEGLRYALLGGTLLGAIRHEGFIPWDDDLDIMMPRPDYERLLSYFETNRDPLLPLVAVHNNGNRRLPFLITRISDTTYREIGEYGIDVEELGAFVDVYPFDGLGDDEHEALEVERKCRLIVDRYMRAGNFKAHNINASAVKRGLKKIRSACYKPAEFYEAQLNELASRHDYDSSTYVTCLTLGSNEGSILFKRSMFDAPIMAPFEDASLPIPPGYDEYLTIKYGDYMKPPPAQNQAGHHLYSLVPRQPPAICE